MKRFAVLLILAVIFAFAGCQEEESESETEQTAETPTETPAETPTETTTETPKVPETVYHKVSFVSDSETTIESQTVESGKTATEPSKPTKTGYTFSAWYDGENAFDFSTPITKDTTLTAKWTANTYTVTLSNNGEESQVSVTFGDKLGDLESVPTMANSSFGGFYTEEYAKGEKFIGADGKGCKAYEIASDTTLYAAWGYRISYENLRERENPNPEIYTGEEDIALLDLENITGFAFAGWYDAETDGNKVETIAKGEYGAKTLYARWETTIFSTVSFDTKGAGEVDSQTVGYTKKAVKPENPENYPYDLMGWFTSSDGGETLSENPFDFESEITEDVKLYAKWEIHATAADVTDKISAMQKSDTVFVSGEITNVRIKEIKTAINKTSVGIALDLSDTTGLTSINGPMTQSENRITHYIGDDFKDCKNLVSIEIPSGVTYIGDGTFSNCSSLTSIEIPSGVTSIRDGTFSGCSSLTSIEIPDSVTSIKSSAFSGCSSLTSIEIPSGVTSIGDEAFKYCENLRSISMPEKLNRIGDFAFNGCHKLENITIPDGVTGIGKGAFASCVSFTSITIPKSVWGAYSNTFNLFACCNNLKSVTILTTLIKFHDGMFKLCSNLESITFAGTVAEWNAHIADGANLTYGSVPATEVVCSDGTVPLK